MAHVFGGEKPVGPMLSMFLSLAAIPVVLKRQGARSAVLLLLGAQLSAATPSLALAAGNAPESAQSVASAPEALRRDIDDLQKQIADIQRKRDKPPKDAWDEASALSGYGSGIGLFLVALFGFFASNIYNRRQQEADEDRKNQSALLDQKKYEAQKNIEELKFKYEKFRWREELASQLALKQAEARLAKYTELWSRVAIVAKHRLKSGELTQSVTRELASHVKDWRYSAGGLLAEPTTRDAAYALQRAAWDYNGTKEGYKRIRLARRILRDSLRCDIGVGVDISGRSLIDVADGLRQIKSDLTNLQNQLGPDNET